MILLDTSVWVDHFDTVDDEVTGLLSSRRIVIHPYVIGELAMGNLRNRDATIEVLNELVMLMPMRHSLIMKFVKNQSLFGTGLQYVDAHLLGSVLTTAGCKIWTRDKRLHAVAERLGVAA